MISLNSKRLRKYALWGVLISFLSGVALHWWFAAQETQLVQNYPKVVQVERVRVALTRSMFGQDKYTEFELPLSTYEEFIQYVTPCEFSRKAERVARGWPKFAIVTIYEKNGSVRTIHLFVNGTNPLLATLDGHAYFRQPHGPNYKSDHMMLYNINDDYADESFLLYKWLIDIKERAGTQPVGTPRRTPAATAS